MNYQKYFKSIALINNPLCGIETYNDILNLATGQATRKVNKLVLTGSEDWRRYSNSNYTYNFSVPSRIIRGLCSHYAIFTAPYIDSIDGIYLSNTNAIIITDLRFNTTADFKAFLESQYNEETPVTVWYVLETSETEQITVPSGLSGTVEGYLTQDRTPTPTDPIYPVANDAVGWYAIKNYVRASTWQDGSTYSRSGGSWSSSLTKKRSRKKK